MIPEKRIEESLTLLAETDSEFGTLRGRCDGLDYRSKIEEAKGYLDAEGTQEQRKSLARTASGFVKMVEEYEETRIAYLTLQARRKREELIVEVWRTQQASSRRGHD